MDVALSCSLWKVFNCPDAVISVDLMFHFVITRIKGPNITSVVILFEMGVGLNLNMYANFKVY